MGSPDLLLEVWKILKADGPALGLILNPTKCEWSWLDPECSAPCPLEQVAIVPTNEIQMLGVPLGSDNFVGAMYLLRISYGIVRVNHFMRTTPLTQWMEIATKFDLCVRDTVSKIIGTTFPGDTYNQECTSEQSTQTLKCARFRRMPRLLPLPVEMKPHRQKW